MTSTAGPPKDKAPSELWSLLTTLPRPSTEVPFPRKHPITKEPINERVAIWVLTEAELMKAKSAADAYARQMLLDAQKSGEANLGYQDIYRNECIVEVVCMACRDLKDLRVPAFPNQAQARQYMTSDEFAVLFQAYCDWQAECGPVLSHMTKDEMNAWIERLTEGASLVPLAALSSDARSQLLLHSVSLLQESRTANGSPGSPPTESSTGTSPTMASEDSASRRHGSSRPSTSGSLGPDERPERPLKDE